MFVSSPRISLRQMRLSVFLAIAALGTISATSQACYDYKFPFSNPWGNCFQNPKQVDMYTEVSLEDNQVDFTIYNDNSFWSSITRIYFDLGTLADDFPTVTITNGPGTNFIDYSKWRKNPWGWCNTGKFSYADVTVAAKCPAFQNGINPGEWVKVSFDFSGGVIPSDIINEINSGDISINVGVTGLPCGGTKELSLVVVPDPATICLLGFGVLGLIRNRKTLS